MYLKPRKASTDPRLRSLLQKAARRGVVPIVERVAAQLDSIGDLTWLRSRTVVIAFEECWPVSGSLALDRSLGSKLRALTPVTRSVKQKDAAGLGALAYAYRQGDELALSFAPDQRMLRIVSEALGRPGDFFRWAFGEAKSEHSTAVVRAAHQYLPAATWEWDKACILAGGLLATVGIVPNLPCTTATAGMEDFPYWVALDKHTDEGKVALREVSAEIGVSYRRLLWASFYCESACVNELEPSPWFDAERTWRLRRAGLSYEEAQELWFRATVRLRDRLAAEAAVLRMIIEEVQVAPSSSAQSSFI